MNNKLEPAELKTPMQKAARLMELKATVKAMKPEIDQLTQELLQVTQELDVYTLKTGSYTISRAKRITPRVEDFQTLKRSLEDAGIDVITEETFAPQMSVVFKQAIEEGRSFDGLEALETEYISIRTGKNA